MKTLMTTVVLSAMATVGGGEGLPAGAPAAVTSSAATPFKGVRTVNTDEQSLSAPPDTVFPLLCPIREGAWLEGWVGKVIYAESGFAEPDGVFATETPGQKDDTLWIVTRRDLARHEIEFVSFVPGIRVVRLTIAVRADGANRSKMRVTYVNTGLSEAGNQFVASSFSEAGYRIRMTEWESAMNHFFTTGRMLKRQP